MFNLWFPLLIVGTITIVCYPIRKMGNIRLFSRTETANTFIFKEPYNKTGYHNQQENPNNNHHIISCDSREKIRDSFGIISIGILNMAGECLCCSKSCSPRLYILPFLICKKPMFYWWIKQLYSTNTGLVLRADHHTSIHCTSRIKYTIVNIKISKLDTRTYTFSVIFRFVIV